MRRVEVYATPEDLAWATASDLASRAKAASGAGRRLRVAISGGTTPRLALELLARPDWGIDWGMVDLFWVDERCVPPDHPDSNYGMAKAALLEPAAVPASSVHRIRGEADPDAEVSRYAAELEACLYPQGIGANELDDPASGKVSRRTPILDLVLLGMGDDGHTASIFPYNAALFRSDRLFEASAHPTSGQRRVTMTGRLIVAARAAAFIVAGASKAATVADIMGRRGGYESYPAWMADEARDGADWRLDEAAAALTGYGKAR